MALQISPLSCVSIFLRRFERYCSVAGWRDADDAATKKLDALLYLLVESR